MTISLSPTPKLSPCLSSERLPRDVIFGVIAGLQKVYPHFSVMTDGLVHESEEKLRAHFLHTGTPSATGLVTVAIVALTAVIMVQIVGPPRDWYHKSVGNHPVRFCIT